MQLFRGRKFHPTERCAVKNKNVSTLGVRGPCFFHRNKQSVYIRLLARAVHIMRFGAAMALSMDVVTTESSSSPPYGNVVFFDLETTGLLDPVRGVTADHIHITELAACRFDDAYEAPLEALVRQPRSADGLSETVQRITGITDELLAREGRPCVDVLRDFVAYVERARGDCAEVYVFSHNRAYDEPILRSAARRCGVAVPDGWRFGCTLAMARYAHQGIRNGAGMSNALGRLIGHYRLDRQRGGVLAQMPHGAHRAGYDARACLLLFEELRTDASASRSDSDLRANVRRPLWNVSLAHWVAELQPRAEKCFQHGGARERERRVLCKRPAPRA